MALDDILLVVEETELKMEETIEVLKKELAAVRTGKANPNILNKINVEYYGVETPVNQIAAISIPEAQTIMIKPFDKSSLGAIEKAIFSSDLGLTPNNNGEVIRLVVPSLTEERRKALAKDIHELAENSKVAIRNVRRNANDSISKAEGVSEDEIESYKSDIQKITDKFVAEIEKLADEKAKEIQTL